MTEIKITITAPELENALNNLAAALDGKAAQVAPTPAPVLAAAMNTPENPAPAPVAAPVPATAPEAAPVIPTAPASTPAAPFAQIPGVPLNATPAPTTATATAPVPTSAPTYTLDQLATAGAALIDAGKLNQVLGLLKKYGVDTLTSLPPQNYGAMATDLRALGARI